MMFKAIALIAATATVSINLNAAPMYYVFEGTLHTVSDSAGMATAQDITVGYTFRTVFLVDQAEPGTNTGLSMYPFLNQQFTTTVIDRSYNNGHTTVDNYYADLITPSLLYGNSWSDLWTIEYNYGSNVVDNGVHYLNLYGSSSPDTTGAQTKITSSAQLSDNFLGTQFRYHETATAQQGSSTLTSALFGTVTLVSITDSYITPVPLPATIWMLSGGLLGIFTIARRRVKRSG